MNDELPEFNWEEENKKSEQRYQDWLKKNEELRAFKKPIIHFIYTLNLDDGSFFNLYDLKGWLNFVKLHFSMFYRPESHFNLHLNAVSKVENEEKFLLPKILNDAITGLQGKCRFEELEFDAWTNGLEFEIVFEENILEKIEYHQLCEIFSRWTSQIFLESLDLLSELDPDFVKFVSDDLKRTMYDYILDLDFYSFIIVTYPDITECKDYLEKSELNKITERIWMNDGAAFRDSFYPPFKDCIVNILGHSYEDLESDDYDVISTLINHLKYWSMYHTLDNFAGLITSIKEIQVRTEVTKTDFIKSLFGYKLTHKQIGYLDGIKYRLDRFLKFGLGERYRGYESDESDAYLNRKIIGNYFGIFNKNRVIFDGVSINLTKKIFVNFNDSSEEKLKKQLESLTKDLKERIEEAIAAINELENNYYRSYELGLNLKAQELTLIGILIFIIQLVAIPIYNFMSYIFGILSKIVGNFLF